MPGPSNPHCPTYESVPPTTDPTFWSEQNRLDEMADKVTVIAKRYPEIYAGVELVTDHSKIIVHRVPSAKFDAAVRAALPGDPVSIVDASHSARELNKLRERIYADSKYWEAQGVPLYSGSVPVDGSCVQISTSDPARAKSLFRLRYGSAPIQLIHGRPAVAR